MKRLLLIAASLIGAMATPAMAHIGLAQGDAVVGSTFRATLVVGHGCAGAATTQIKVQVPEGFYNVRPMPKAGWQLEVETGTYGQPFENHGTTLTEGVKVITWSGGDLPDSQFDEFVFRGTFGTNLEPGTTFYFPVLQQCGEVEDAWIDTSGEEDAEYPAPSVELQPASGGHSH